MACISSSLCFPSLVCIPSLTCSRSVSFRTDLLCPQTSSSVPASASLLSGGAKPMSELQQKFHKKLQSGQFRFLNEQLYTTTGLSTVEITEQRGREEKLRGCDRSPENCSKKIHSFFNLIIIMQVPKPLHCFKKSLSCFRSYVTFLPFPQCVCHPFFPPLLHSFAHSSPHVTLPHIFLRSYSVSRWFFEPS